MTIFAVNKQLNEQAVVKKKQKIHVDLSDVGQDNNYQGYFDHGVAIFDDIRELSKIEVLKMGLNTIIGCFKGRLQLTVNNDILALNNEELLIVHSNTQLDDFMMSPDFECKVFCFTDDALNGLLQSDVEIWNNALYIHKVNILRMNDNDESNRTYYYNLIKYKWNRPEGKFKRKIIDSILRAALLEFCDKFVKNYAVDETQHVNRDHEIFHQFLELLASMQVKRQPVTFYAEELCITPKYFSAVCKTVSGKSPLTWISEYVIEDIRSNLLNTKLSCKEISDKLGFPNSSFFGKYVLEHIGSSPMEYRKNNVNITNNNHKNEQDEQNKQYG